MIKINLKYLVLGLCIVFMNSIIAQIDDNLILTLDDCIRLVNENNLELKGRNLDVKSSLVNAQQAKNDLFPTLDFNFNYGLSKGRSIDPFSNDYINEQLRFSYSGLSIDAPIFNGMRLKKLISQSEKNKEVAELNKQATLDNITLNVTLQYFEILRIKDLFTLSGAREITTTKQLERLKSLYEEGVGNPAAYFDLKSQLASDQLTKLDAKSNKAIQIAQLATMINIDPNTIEDIQIIKDTERLDAYPYTNEEVFQSAIINLPVVKSTLIQKESDLLGTEIIKSEYYPTISLFGQLNTNFSSNANTFADIGTEVRGTDNFVTLDNQDIPVFKNQPIFSSDRINYFSQFKNNLNSVIGVSLSIPIFDRKQKKSQLALQQIVVDQSEVAKNTVIADLRESIQVAYEQMYLSYTRTQILQTQIDALEESFRVNEIRFNSGVSNVVEYLESKNNLESAKINLINSKYEYQLRTKILDYFRE